MTESNGGSLFSGPRVVKKYSAEFRQKFVSRVMAGESASASSAETDQSVDRGQDLEDQERKARDRREGDERTFAAL